MAKTNQRSDPARWGPAHRRWSQHGRSLRKTLLQPLPSPSLSVADGPTRLWAQPQRWKARSSGSSAFHWPDQRNKHSLNQQEETPALLSVSSDLTTE